VAATRTQGITVDTDNNPASHVRRNIMAATRTQGITVDTDGNFTINKEYRGVRLFF